MENHQYHVTFDYFLMLNLGFIIKEYFTLTFCTTSCFCGFYFEVKSFSFPPSLFLFIPMVDIPGGTALWSRVTPPVTSLHAPQTGCWRRSRSDHLSPIKPKAQIDKGVDRSKEK